MASDTQTLLHFASLTDVARRLERKELSPVDLTRTMLERIETVDARLKSYATVTAERALDAARAAEAEINGGRYRGPLHGMPVAVKDLCFTRGIPTMAGMAIRKDFVPDRNATVIERLDAAGAVLLGKLALTEGAMVGYHREFDVPVNPWESDLWPGASSSGSGVATAAGLCFASLGSDTGGSIRFPSLANGIVGLKPTYGRVSRHGVLDLGETLDHVGPMTRGVEDAAIVLAAIAGRDPADPTSSSEPVPTFADLADGVRGLTLGYDANYATDGTDAELVASIEAALETLRELGAEVREIKVPEGTVAIGELWFPICTYEAHKAHAEYYPARAAEYGAYFRDFLQIGAGISDAQYADAMAARREFSARYEAALGEVDALVCPAGGVTFPTNADPYGDAAALAPMFEAVQMQFTVPADFAGSPSLTVPCGASATGIPHALQLVGRSWSEARLCRIGKAYETATPWHDRHPPV
jgi:amidase